MVRRSLRSLEWLPWRNDQGWHIDQRQDYNEKELADLDPAVSKKIQAKLEKQRQEWTAAGLTPEPIENLYAVHLVSLKMSYNRYWAKYHVYEQSGWPDKFDKDEFTKRQAAFNAKARELGALDAAGEEETEPSKALREFYRAEAGARSV